MEEIVTPVIKRTFKHKIYLVHEQYDIVDAEIRIKHNNEFLNIFIKPFGFEGTKVTICSVGKNLRKVFILENKNYRGSL